MDNNSNNQPPQTVSNTTFTPPTSSSFGPSPNGSDETGSKKIGPVIAILIIVLVLVIAALYLFASRVNDRSSQTENITNDEYSGIMTSSQTSVSVEPVTNTSDDPDNIQADLYRSDQGLNDSNF
ncbi:MAG: hypothetical protein A3B11_00390 [Candidatus Taylorbacteria bacterium RIFCSPLOWO2_01_FULL_44_26]|uniref:Uncharacterized protein n=1 Tax=Candidatus Taylorbacteria bacterium RIFCSPLOWO2_01_FULL_44_26 TaxID=1802318 RepID=A0A1G2N4P6_9BACT|nr:MAG: hypothetical protein A3B11_00390 [Candidatus Taylorbacteria bacterium RIFCSPLOWO2_01_FULL_44_26]